MVESPLQTTCTPWTKRNYSHLHLLNSLKKSARAMFSIRNSVTSVNSILTTTLTRRMASGKRLHTPLPVPIKPPLLPPSRSPPFLLKLIPRVVNLVRLRVSRVLWVVRVVLCWVSLVLCLLGARPLRVTMHSSTAPPPQHYINVDKKSGLFV